MTKGGNNKTNSKNKKEPTKTTTALSSPIINQTLPTDQDKPIENVPTTSTVDIEPSESLVSQKENDLAATTETPLETKLDEEQISQESDSDLLTNQEQSNVKPEDEDCFVPKIEKQSTEENSLSGINSGILHGTPRKKLSKNDETPSSPSHFNSNKLEEELVNLKKGLEKIDFSLKSQVTHLGKLDSVDKMVVKIVDDNSTFFNALGESSEQLVSIETKLSSIDESISQGQEQNSKLADSIVSEIEQNFSTSMEELKKNDLAVCLKELKDVKEGVSNLKTTSDTCLKEILNCASSTSSGIKSLDSMLEKLSTNSAESNKTVSSIKNELDEWKKTNPIGNLEKEVKSSLQTLQQQVTSMSKKIDSQIENSKLVKDSIGSIDDKLANIEKTMSHHIKENFEVSSKQTSEILSKNVEILNGQLEARKSISELDEKLSTSFDNVNKKLSDLSTSNQKYQENLSKQIKGLVPFIVVFIIAIIGLVVMGHMERQTMSDQLSHLNAKIEVQSQSIRSLLNDFEKKPEPIAHVLIQQSPVKMEENGVVSKVDQSKEVPKEPIQEHKDLTQRETEFITKEEKEEDNIYHEPQPEANINPEIPNVKDQFNDLRDDDKDLEPIFEDQSKSLKDVMKNDEKPKKKATTQKKQVEMQIPIPDRKIKKVREEKVIEKKKSSHDFSIFVHESFYSYKAEDLIKSRKYPSIFFKENSSDAACEVKVLYFDGRPETSLKDEIASSSPFKVPTLIIFSSHKNFDDKKLSVEEVSNLYIARAYDGFKRKGEETEFSTPISQFLEACSKYK